MRTEPFEILFIEDQVRHQKVYQQAISDHLPACVRFAADGNEAMAIIESDRPPDLVILDLEMPKVRGEQVLERIKGDYRLRYTPVIILTGHGSFETQMELLEKGADDFIEKGATPEVLIARLKAQMRHKLAVDRLERAALDRDLFAAGVLQDIGGIKWSIVSLCRQAKEKIKAAPRDHQAEIRDCLDKLAAHGAKIGQYAHDVIQSVRDTQRPSVIAPQEVRKLVEWVGDILASGGEATASRIVWELATDLTPVLADRNYLKLALLNIVQHMLRSGGTGPARVIRVTQEPVTASPDTLNRRLVRTLFHDEATTLAERDIAKLFEPYTRGASTSGFNLGLSLVAKVTAKMGGQVFARAGQGGKGVIYAVELPVAD